MRGFPPKWTSKCLPALCARSYTIMTSTTSSSSSVSDRSGRTTPKQGGQDLREKLSLWESSLATLSDRQKDGVMTLSAVANSRPIPKDVSDVRWNVTGSLLTVPTRSTPIIFVCFCCTTEIALSHRQQSSYNSVCAITMDLSSPSHDSFLLRTPCVSGRERAAREG